MPTYRERKRTSYRLIVSAITARITRFHTDLVPTYGLQAVMEAIDYQAEVLKCVEDTPVEAVTKWVSDIEKRLEKAAAAKSLNTKDI